MRSWLNFLIFVMFSLLNSHTLKAKFSRGLTHENNTTAKITMYSVTRCNEAGDSVTSDPVNAFSNKRIEGYGVLDVILVKGHRLFCGGGWQRAAVVVWRPAQLITTLA